MKYRRLRKTSGKRVWLQLSKRIRSVMRDPEEVGEENAGVTVRTAQVYADGKESTENP